MINWDAAYNRMSPLLETLRGPDFMRVVREVDKELPDYMEYIQKRRDAELSTTKRHYFKDILFAYDEDIRQHLFEILLSLFESSNPDEVKKVRLILSGGKVDIREEIYSKALASKEIDEDLLSATLNGLKAHPEADRLYKQALTLYETGQPPRHILDDIRLSLEYYLRDILQNGKTLENQLPLITSHLREKGVSVEIVNLFRQLFDYLNKYQNENVKHWDEVKPSEVDLIVNLTNSVYRFLLNNK